MSVFSTWLQSEMDGRGWDQRDLSKAVGVAETTVHNWLHKGVPPSMESVVKIYRGLGVSLATVMERAGYGVVSNSESGDARQGRRAAILAGIPRFAEIIDRVARLRPDEQDAYLSAIERFLPPDTPPGNRQSSAQ